MIRSASPTNREKVGGRRPGEHTLYVMRIYFYNFRRTGSKVNVMPISGKPGILIVRLIHRSLWISVISICAVYSLHAQEPSKKEMSDTLVKKPLINQSLMRGFNSTIILPQSLRDMPEYVPVSLHQSLMNLPTSLSSQFQQQIDVVSPWKQELSKQNELRTLKTSPVSREILHRSAVGIAMKVM